MSEEFHKIGDVALDLGVTLRTLRFYEQKGLVAPVKIGLTRLYTDEMVSLLRDIHAATVCGFTISQIKGFLSKGGGLVIDDVTKRERLLALREEILDKMLAETWLSGRAECR
jgi:DNA-binding transcriptional MerR regulator